MWRVCVSCLCCLPWQVLDTMVEIGSPVSPQFTCLSNVIQYLIQEGEVRDLPVLFFPEPCFP